MTAIPRPRPGPRRTAGGAAIVLAMLLAALAATIAATLFADQQRWTRMVTHRAEQAQAQALAMAGVQWARQIINGDARAVDHLREPWAVALPPIPFENGEIRGAIADAQGRLNVNALGNPPATPPATDFERNRIARLFAPYGDIAAAMNAIGDWMDSDAIPRPDGAEDAYYGDRSVPGLAANAPVLRVAALAAVAPFLTALPPGTAVNVNTAPLEVLATFIDGLSGADLAAFIANRDQKPFASLADFRTRLPPGAKIANESLLGVTTNYFYVSVEARQGTTIARARALLQRGSGSGSQAPWPEIVWQVVE